MDFKQRLEQAIQRGNHAQEVKSIDLQKAALTQEQLKRMHSQYRLQLSEHIERCLGHLPQHFPGFSLETVVSDRGWGATVSRDDIVMHEGRRTTFFSRLEMVVRPFSSAHVLDLTARGTIFNKEIYNRNHYQLLAEVDLQSFTDTVDLWVLEYAELYAAKR